MAVPTVQVSDTTGDAIFTIANNNILVLFYKLISKV